MKYGNRRVEFNGIRFDSIKERDRYCELKLLERAGKIKDLKIQKEFVLLPAQYEGEGKERKCIERGVKYKADFYYYDVSKGKYICEDTKGYRTPEYILKRKLMLYINGIRIVEL